MVSWIQKKIFLLLLLCSACSGQILKKQTLNAKLLVLGAERIEQYLPDLEGKNVAMVVNHTSLLGKIHLVDSLKLLGINIKIIFAPEHGFRGNADAGEQIKDGTDTKTGLPIVSLYGSNKKPTARQLEDIDVVVFDIQDVGVRYYTFPSTMHYVLEACAENNKKCIVLDRPNPNGHLVDGPILDRRFASFVGLNPIPILHGLTLGELATMIQSEGWLKNSITCNLKVITMQNYRHNLPYDLPIAPSPNLPNRQAVLWYASLCLFEPTITSVGRGTNKQFQVIGVPDPRFGHYTFVPHDSPGANNPLHEGKTCYGYDLSQTNTPSNGLTLKYLLEFYQKAPNKEKFFSNPSFFDKLAGTDQLRQQLIDGMSENTIRNSWKNGLESYKKLRKKYLMYE